MAASVGDSAYIVAARRIQENVLQLAEISAELRLPHITSADIHGRLKEARSLAVETHGMLKRFSAVASADVYGTEKGQRRMTHKKLKTQYQAALKAIDTAAQQGLGLPQQQPNEPSVTPAYDSDSICSSSGRSRASSSRQLPVSLRHASDQPTAVDNRNCTYRAAYPKRSSVNEIYREGHPQPPPVGVEMVEGTSGGSTSAGVSSTCSLSRQELECFSPQQHHLMVPLTAQQQQQRYDPAYHSVLQIEKDVRGIRELYKEMAWQVSNSVDDLDAIESQMRSAVAFSAQGVDQLTSAHHTLRSRRRLLFFAISSACIIALVVFAAFKLMI